MSGSPDEVVTGFYYRGGVLFKAEVGVKGDAEEFYGSRRGRICQRCLLMIH